MEQKDIEENDDINHINMTIELSKWQRFKRFFWDPDSKQCLGRNGSSWVKLAPFIITFLVISLLVGGFFVYWYVLLDEASVDSEGFLVGQHLGLAFHPAPSEFYGDSKLIWYKANNPGSNKFWTDRLNGFLKDYKFNPYDDDTSAFENRVNCEYGKPPPPGKACLVKLDYLSPCTDERSYMYPANQPCILIYFKKVAGWKPEFYNDTENLPDNMPINLQNRIKSTKGWNPLELETIWITCVGENPADVENIGPIQYKPRAGFPGYFFPYFNTVEGYLSPLVAIWFENPHRNTIINVVCKAWAKNIRPGYDLHFQFQID